MLKLGICNASQDTPIQAFWRRGLIAANLLATSKPATAAERQRFDRLMSDIRLSSGVTRLTARGRFAAFDQHVECCLRNVFPDQTSIVVEDWAVSNGITAAEWFAVLRSDFPQITFTASDRTLYLVEARRQDVGDTYIVQPDGGPVQYIRPPFVVSLTRLQSPLFLVNRHIQQRALREWTDSLRASFHVPQNWNFLHENGWTVAPPFVIRPLPLIHPDVLELGAEEFRVRQHSVFEPLREPVDVIRTMNILNRSYFTEAQLQTAAKAVERSLKSGGVWIVGRTIREDPPTHDATVLRKVVDSWQVLLRVGHGSEIEPLLDIRG